MIGAASIATASWPGPGSPDAISARSTTSVGSPDAAGNDQLRVHVSELLAQWQASVADVYAKFGDPPSVAEEQTTVLLAAIEGAVILARARRSSEPLDAVERYFASRPPASRSP